MNDLSICKKCEESNKTDCVFIEECPDGTPNPNYGARCIDGSILDIEKLNKTSS
ncbi:MAG: hypothetical protein PHN69_04410 [Candidatus Pacebacteria bacterium]|nr:hypothetical protein [Candidatus Paceibacterota bacterium]